MAASESNIEIEIEIASTHFLDKLDAWWRKNDRSEESIQEKAQLVKEYHTSLQSIQSASQDKFKLAVETLETLSLQRYSRLEHSIHCSWILHAEQDLNQYLLSTALRQRASEILISDLETDNTNFFQPLSNPEGYGSVRLRIEEALHRYYLVCPKNQGFAETVNLFKELDDEDKKRNFCTMVYYSDRQWDEPDSILGGTSLSAALIKAEIITLRKMKKSLEPLEPFLQSSDDDQSSQAFSDDEENDENDSWGIAPEIGCLGAVIDDMSPEAQLGAAFCLFAVGALTATAGVLLALVLVHSVIPSLGITSPIAIGGCVAAAVGIVSGVALMGASIKMAQNAFALFPSPDEVEKPSTPDPGCFRHFFC